jgi:hypothetical protein
MQVSGETLSKYDVLTQPPVPGVSTEYSLEEHSHHIGNQRFHVLLAINQDSYEKARLKGDFVECNRLVDGLVDTVCNQVVPRGRFLESLSKGATIEKTALEHQWKNMDESTIKSLLHKELTSFRDRLPVNPNDTPASAFAETSSSLIDSANEFEAQIPSTSSVPSMPEPMEDLDDGQKRRRRSSLLRRSNSESMLGLFLDNRKKLNLNAFDPRGNTQEEPTCWKSTTTLGELSRMDVVFTAERDALDPSCMSVGNNRLHILSAVRSAAFKQGSIEAQEQILDEMIEIVSVFWKGRFHVEVPGGYEGISSGEARDVMRIILSGKENGKQRQRHSDTDVEIARFRTIAQTGVGSEAGSTASAHHLLSSRLPAALMENAQKNQNRALLELKKQKARNQNASELKEKLGVKSKKQQASEGTNTSSSNQEQALFPLGGMVQPSMFGSQSQMGRTSSSTSGYQMNGSLSLLPVTSVTSMSSSNFGYQMNGSLSSLPRPAVSRSSFKPRQSSIFDAKMMEDLAAEMDDSDYSDDIFDSEPLPQIKDSPDNDSSVGSH